MKKIAILSLALILALSLTACGGGVTPDGDSSTPGTSSPSVTEPDNTPNAPNEPVVLLPDPENLSEEYLEHIHGGDTIASLGGAEAVDNMLDEIYEEYGRFLNENISKNCVKIGIFSILSFDEGAGEITPEALEKVNELLKSNGEEPLDNTKESKQKITAFWLAASLYYDPDYIGDESQQIAYGDNSGWRFDIAHAFALAKYSDPEGARSYEDLYASDYAHLFNFFD